MKGEMQSTFRVEFFTFHAVPHNTNSTTPLLIYLDFSPDILFLIHSWFSHSINYNLWLPRNRSSFRESSSRASRVWNIMWSKFRLSCHYFNNFNWQTYAKRFLQKYFPSEQSWLNLSFKKHQPSGSKAFPEICMFKQSLRMRVKHW
jgi:hypothetical protein